MNAKKKNKPERQEDQAVKPENAAASSPEGADSSVPEGEAVPDTKPEAPETAPEVVDAAPETDKHAELLDRYQRQLAEFDNYRKRTTKEKAAMYDEGTRDTVEKLLTVVDNFERALAASEDKEDKFYTGVAMIARQLDGVLADLGVQAIPAERGTVFDPNLHFAVAHEEDAELGDSQISGELQKGYRHKDKVIRPSMVRVAN